ncbi:hypothetical protein POTOM_044586 [Populus tomentosa]|uniref:Ribosomal protein/NADH dehydrogenase domain-containing protein n=1 Tax=Populus tomentosa TaxID=118781 RepID=A0A8X8CFN0_POPTO|nr:hypothetical protein POTOM_044586 [Populus tomentosa]
MHRVTGNLHMIWMASLPPKPHKTFSQQRPVPLLRKTLAAPSTKLKMAWKGMWQLKKLVVSYCDWGGSSRGISFGHVRNKSMGALGRKCIDIEVGVRKGGSRPKDFPFDVTSPKNEQGRAFIESNLPAFKDSNPQLEVLTELSRGQHPCLKAFYKNKNERVVCVKNLASEDVLLHATRLRNALGRKVKKLPTRHVTKHPSVQGTWTTDVRF